MRNEVAPLLVPDIDTRAPIIRPAENAWRTAMADRLDVLVHGQAYFKVLEGILEQARREVWIVGWDFNPDIPMQPGVPQSPTLGAFLLHLEEERYGDALLTALHTRLVKADGLPSRGEPRGVLWVEVPVDDVTLQIFVTHLGLFGAERMRQTEALIGPGWLGAPMADDARIILAGDLNAISRSRSYRMLARRFRDAQVDAGGRPAATFPSRLPLLRIDHIFIGEGISASRTFVHDTPLARQASDHLPLCADLEIA